MEAPPVAKPAEPATVDFVDVPLQPAAEEAAPEPPVIEAAQVPVQAAPPAVEVPATAAEGTPEPRGAPAPGRTRLRYPARLVGPLGLGLAAGCMALFILGLGVLGAWQGLNTRYQQQAKKAAEHYQLGLDRMHEGAYSLAVEEFKQALRLRSNYPEARQKLMEAQAKASEQPSPAPPTSPGESSSLLSAGRAAYDRGDWDEAIAKLEALQSADPNYEQAAVQRLLAAAYEYSGLKLINEGSMEEAIRRFNQALALEPDNPDIQLQSRLATLYQGGISTWGVDWNQTIKNLAAVYALKPDYVDIAERLLKAYVEAGDAAGGGAAWCDAVEYYKLALDLSSTPELAAKRDDAAHRCASGEGPPGGTPVPTGTYVGTFAGLVDNRKRTTDWAEVRGHVRNAAGKGVANAQVKVSAFDWATVHTTDGNGYYSIEFLNHEITFTVSLVGLPMQPVDVPTRFGYAAVANFNERK